MEGVESKEKPAAIQIERASESDVEDILNVQRDTWIATYPNDEYGISKEDLEAKDWKNSDRVERWRKFVSEADPNTAMWVAKDRGKVIGFLRAAKGDLENDLQAVYILPGYQGKGIGTKLMSEFLEWVDEDKDTVLGVVAYNQNAINFYKRYGFDGDEGIPPGDVPDLPSGKTIPEIRMVLKAEKS